jgi:hypothetical protein
MVWRAYYVGHKSSVGKATHYRLDGPGIEAERSKAKVCDRSFAGIAGSNSAGSMDICVVQ